MSALEPLCHTIGINPYQLSKEEGWLLETELFDFICEELRELYKLYYRDYFRLMKLSKEMEIEMLEMNFLPFVINDILSTREYTLEGIAHYTYTSEEVINDVVLGKNSEPSYYLTRKIISLHRSVRPELYVKMMKKIVHEYLIPKDIQNDRS